MFDDDYRIGYMLDNRYRLEAIVGHGNCLVWRATDANMGKIWAVKELRPTHPLLQGMTEKSIAYLRNTLLEEANLMKGLSHSALPRVTDIIEADGSLFIVMDFVFGVDLRKWTADKGRRFTVDETVEIGCALCDALQYLHTPQESTGERQGKPAILYCDLKPENVMLDGDRVQLLDFNACIKLGDRVRGYTDPFAAPEMKTPAVTVDERVDIYALGVLLHDLLIGEWTAPDEPYTTSIREYDPSLPVGLDRIISRCIETEREKRYSSMAELREALENYQIFDPEWLKKQKAKVATFRGLLVAAAVFLVTGAIGMGASALLKQDTFSEKLLEAQHVNLSAEASPQDADYKTKAGLYSEAISVDGSHADAYRELLKDVYLADDVFDENESEQFYGLLSAYGDRCSAADYAALCYDYADKLLFYRSDYTQAANWYQRAIDTGALSSSLGQTAAAYKTICSFSQSLMQRDEKGDSSNSARDFRTYWDSLVSCLESQKNTDATVFSQLKVCELVLDATTGPTFVRQFKNSEIPQEELESIVEKVRNEMSNLPESDLSTSQSELKAQILSRCGQQESPAAGTALETIRRIYSSGAAQL